MNPIHKFTPPNIAKKLNKINQNLSASHQKPFPKANFLSQYSFQKRFVGIEPNGDIQGGYAGMVASLIDFSFVRSMVADAYSIFGPPCYDPVTLFLLDLFRYIDDYRDMNAFLEVVRDERRGKDYRDYAGILEDIPSEGTFSNFRERIGEQRHNDIFHGMVGIFHDLEMITFKILSHDGTLYPSWARYKGCTYFCDQCASIRVPDVRSKIKAAVIRRLNAKNNLDSEIRVKVDCPSDRFPKNSEIRIPKIEVFSLKLAFVDGATTTEQNNNAAYFDLHDELRKQALCIQTLRSNIDNFTDDGSIIIACPKLPKDTDARIGVRRHPINPDKKEKIFGYNAIFSTSVEPHLGIELPVAVSNISGNAEEGSYLVINREQIQKHHGCKTAADLADSKFDIISNYHYIRSRGAIPIIDYNPRNEKLSKDDLLQRGYDQHGIPFAPCGLLTRPNGFDHKYQRLTCCCFKQCRKLTPKAMGELKIHYDLAICPYTRNETGYTKHMYVKEHPRLINAIPRGTKKYQRLKQHRSASERINSAVKEDIPILRKPRVINGFRAKILAQLAASAILLKRAFSFIAKITTLVRKYHRATDQKIKAKLQLLLTSPIVPTFIQKLIQRE